MKINEKIIRNLLIAAVLGLAAFAIVGCGDGEDDSSSFKLYDVYVANTENKIKNEESDATITAGNIYFGFKITNTNSTFLLDATLTDDGTGEVVRSLNVNVKDDYINTIYIDTFSDVNWSRPASGYYTLTITVSSNGKTEKGSRSFRVL